LHVSIFVIAFIQKDISIEFSFDNDRLDNSALLARSKTKTANAVATKQKMGFDFFSSKTEKPKTNQYSQPRAVLVKESNRRNPLSSSISRVNTKGVKGAMAPISNKNQAYEYLDRFDSVAESEANKFNLEKSVILGLGLYHASSPKTALAVKANNYFAMPCTPDWKGESISHNDACYRTYESAWFSFRDQSKYLNLLQKNMNRGEKMSISQWATVLKKNGIISSQHRFLQLVEAFKL